jgi:hypothetical protein
LSVVFKSTFKQLPPYSDLIVAHPALILASDIFIFSGVLCVTPPKFGVDQITSGVTQYLPRPPVSSIGNI